MNMVIYYSYNYYSIIALHDTFENEYNIICYKIHFYFFTLFDIFQTIYI